MLSNNKKLAKTSEFRLIKSMALSKRCGTYINFTQSQEARTLKCQNEYRKSNRNQDRRPNPYRPCQDSRSIGLTSFPSCCFVAKRINFVLSGLI